jgi:hypothetical protein
MLTRLIRIPYFKLNENLSSCLQVVSYGQTDQRFEANGHIFAAFMGAIQGLLIPLCLPASNGTQISLPVWLKFGIVYLYRLRFWFSLIHFNPAVPSLLMFSLSSCFGS